MNRAPVVALALVFLLPTIALAASEPASFSAARSLLIASSSSGNAYATGGSVVVTAPVAGDLSAVGGSIITTAPVSGDALLFAGSVNTRAQVTGDMRAVAGTVDVGDAVGGDLVAFGLSVRDGGRTDGSVFIVAANTSLTNGADGPVTIYGNNISLSGDFAGNVTIVASGHVGIADNTVIRGKLVYEAPEPAEISSSAKVVGGVAYKNASYLPDVQTSRVLAVASLGFFIFARILGALILAGLLAGLFPRFSASVVDAAVERPGRILLTTLLGFGMLVASPVFIILLLLTFVGIGLAILLFILYALLAFLAFMYAGILLGGVFARRFLHRTAIVWHDGAFGMLALSLIAFIPVVGLLVVILLATFAAGALSRIFFTFAFPHEGYTSEML
ncbi:MAG: hypothetical protein WAN50_05335 [Minisyncoccia bacterium]